jgi:hypothetical protein
MSTITNELMKILLNYILILRFLFLGFLDFEEFSSILTPLEVGGGEYNIECLF